MNRRRKPANGVSLLTLTLLAFSYVGSGQDLSTSGMLSAGFGKTCTPFIPATFNLKNRDARSLEVGDFNGDGILDFAVRTSDSLLRPRLSILLGKKDGTFGGRGTYRVGATSIGSPIAVGDFNGDGKLDVIAASGSAIVVFLGNGDGTFQAGRESPTTMGPLGIAVGDFNQDGRLDIAVAQFQSAGDTQVMIGNGDGTFQAPVNYPVTSYPTAVAVADFNHDGHLDLAVANGGNETGNTVSVLLGSGDGTFRPRVDYTIGLGPFSITAVDLNGDGLPDLATADFTSGTTSVLLNKGNGTFQPVRIYVAGHPFAPYRVTAAPLESGSKPSLAVATIAGTYILVNNGDGTFKAAQGYEPVSTGVVLADLNGDGKTDLAVAGGFDGEGGSGGVTIIKGQGHGVFMTPTAYVAAPNLGAITAGDFNGDGIPDVAAIGLDFKVPYAILLGQGNATFAPPVFYHDVGPEFSDIGSGDFNGDGKRDLAIAFDNASFTNPRVQVLLGNGDGTFALGKVVYGVPGRAVLTFADFNDDGILDLAATGGLSSGGVTIFLGRGDGGFRKVSAYAGAGRLMVGDFNGDGKLDLAVTNTPNPAVSIYLGNGNGTFTNAANYSTAFAGNALTVGDFNGDGKLDLAVGHTPRNGDPVIQVFLGVGDGTFQSGATFTGGYAPVAADFNGDGKVDLAVVNQFDLLQLLIGNGDGTFTAGALSSIGQVTQYPVLADLNGDGAPDLIVPNIDGGEISVLLNQCSAK